MFYTGLAAGVHVLQWFSGKENVDLPPLIQSIYNEQVTYTVSPVKKSKPCASLPPTVTIPNVRSPGYIHLSIHVNTETEEKPNDFFFDLVSTDKHETRYYKLVFRDNIHADFIEQVEDEMS